MTRIVPTYHVTEQTSVQENSPDTPTCLVAYFVRAIDCFCELDEHFGRLGFLISCKGTPWARTASSNCSCCLLGPRFGAKLKFEEVECTDDPPRGIYFSVEDPWPDPPADEAAVLHRLRFGRNRNSDRFERVVDRGELLGPYKVWVIAEQGHRGKHDTVTAAIEV